MSTPTDPHPTQDAIKERARKIWIAEGQPENKSLEHWLAAERQLKSEAPPERKDEVIDLESDTAYGNIDSIPPMEASGAKDEVIPTPFAARGRSKDTTSL